MQICHFLERNAAKIKRPNLNIDEEIKKDTKVVS